MRFDLLLRQLNRQTEVIPALNAIKPLKIFLSAHDSGGHSLARMQQELKPDTEILEAGKTYRFGQIGPETAH
jgi:hypothetical protein